MGLPAKLSLTGHTFYTYVHVYESSKGQTISKVNYDFLNYRKKRTALTILSKEEAQDSELRSILGELSTP